MAGSGGAEALPAVEVREDVSPFLDPADVQRLTGYEMASYQLKWCKANGVPAWLNARGEVIIARTAVEGRPKAENDPAWSPDFTVLRKA